jgi:predicted unusual protein kinase regulating ubiquinone biosynthesis (AarF/ABC1/UbiB family)
MVEPARSEAPDRRDDPAPSPREDSAIPRAGDSVTALAHNSRRYRDDTHAKRPPLRIRSVRAYWATFRVIFSYLWLRFRARFHSDAWIENRLQRLHLRNARRIEGTIVELQGLFIKVGQLISIMTNFLPEEFRRELEGLQDAVPPRPYADMEARIVEELGSLPDELFAQFDRRPIASASIGQVHIARMLDGQKVAVKVQYPDIEVVVRRDLNTLRRIARSARSCSPSSTTAPRPRTPRASRRASKAATTSRSRA